MKISSLRTSFISALSSSCAVLSLALLLRSVLVVLLLNPLICLPGINGLYTSASLSRAW